ncbi:MAG: cysteine hydrolase [Pseudomonadota bacterium]
MLLVVDMQEDFFLHERLANHRSMLTQRTNELAGICRAAECQVIWVKQEFAADLHDAPLDLRAKGTPIVVMGTPGAALLAELKPEDGDAIVVKKRYSAFYGTRLDALLGSLRPNRLLIAGINTHACIRSTVVDAYQRDYQIVLARECIDSHDAEHHDVSWRYMNGKLGAGLSNEHVRSLLANDA